VENYLKLGHTISVQRAYRKNFNSKWAPRSRDIKAAYDRFKKTGSIKANVRMAGQGTNKRENAVIAIKALIEENATLSARKVAAPVGVSQSLCQTIMLNDLGLKPYKYQSCHELLAGDPAKRVDFANWYLTQSVDMMDHFIVTDEAWFYMTLPYNKQNSRIWLKERPVDWIETPLHDEKIMAWCGFSIKKFMDHIFLMAMLISIHI